ncbi:hypothetical protein EON63_10135 [archaeon]|nr:MAG: hypothetical protein EON63_10135 [archaeon]
MDDTQVGIGMLDDVYSYTPSSSLYGFNSNNTSMYVSHTHTHTQQYRQHTSTHTQMPGQPPSLPSLHSNVSILSTFSDNTQTGSLYRTHGSLYGVAGSSLYSFMDNSHEDLYGLLDLPPFEPTQPLTTYTSDIPSPSVASSPSPTRSKNPIGQPKNPSY